MTIFVYIHTEYFVLIFTVFPIKIYRSKKKNKEWGHRKTHRAEGRSQDLARCLPSPGRTSQQGNAGLDLGREGRDLLVAEVSHSVGSVFGVRRAGWSEPC